MGSMKGKRMGSSQRLHMWTGNTRGRPNIQISHTWRGLCWSFVAFGGVIVMVFQFEISTNIQRMFLVCQGFTQTLPKAQRTRWLSSSCQSNFLRSYHKFKHKPWSNFIFRISTKHQLLNQTSASPINLKFKILQEARNDQPLQAVDSLHNFFQPKKAFHSFQ